MRKLSLLQIGMFFGTRVASRQWTQSDLVGMPVNY